MNSNRPKLLILYSEVMPYTLAMIDALVTKYNYEILLIFWDENRLTPFNFEVNNFYKAFPRSKFSGLSDCDLIVNFQPDIIWTSGRMDKLYLQLNAHFKKKNPSIRRVMGSDNQWFGDVKDKIKAVLGYWLYRQYFDYCWVAGPSQKEFAKKVGFKESHIIDNILTCDFAWFEKQSTLTEKRILYVGRFAENKNLGLLIAAFLALPTELIKDWKLRLVGSGEAPQTSQGSNQIEIFPFENQEKLIEHGLNSSIFCLPSKHEPYGVVVHEFAALGLPLLLSNRVGARYKFLEEGVNGYSFKFDDVEDCKNYLIKLISLDQNDLTKLGYESRELASKLTPDVSAASLNAIL